MALTPIQELKFNVGDDDPQFPYLSDDEYQHLLNKYGSVRIATLQAARVILFRLTRCVDEYVDILSIRGRQHFEQYKQALMLLLNDEQFSSVSQALPYAGNISKEDIEENRSNVDNYPVRIDRAVANESEGYDFYDEDNPFNRLKYGGSSSDPFGI